MPVVRFRVRSEYGHADPELYGAADRDDPEALLEGVAMAGLVGVLRQLGDLAEFAAGIFHNLYEEVMSTSARGHSLMLRVQQLEVEFPVVEKAFLSRTTHLHAVNNTGIEWHPNVQISQNLITSGDMPRFILDSYEECRGPPRLFMLDKFDVAGAGACLKRYSDPSFFKTDLTSSGAIEPELQREMRPRKTKRKNLRWRNDENLDSLSEPHTLILNHMHPEKAQTFPVKRVKLKTKPLNYRDTTTTSYMECVLESYVPSGDISNSNTIEHLPVKAESADSNAPILEIHASTADVSFNGENAVEEKKKEIEQMIAKSLPIDDAGLQLQSFGSPEKIIGNNEENALKILLNETSIELNQHEAPADAEDRTDAGSDVYVSDDVASELDNYMDALATIESETETDNENRPKPQFSLSDEELQEKDAEAHNENKRKNLQVLSADLSKDQQNNSLSETEVSCFANENLSNILSDPVSVQNRQVQRRMCENAEITSPPANEELFGFPLQPLVGDKLQNVVYQSQISSSDSHVISGVTSSGQHDLISKQERCLASKSEMQNTVNEESLFETSSSISEFVEASCSSLPMHSASSTYSGAHGNSGRDHPTIANPHTTYSDSSVGDVCLQSDTGENCSLSDKAKLVSSVYNDTDNTKVPIKISDSDLKCLLDDFEPPSMVNESLVEGAQIEVGIPDVSHEQLLDAENQTLIPNYEDNLEIKPCLDCAVDPTQDTLTTEPPKSYGCEDVSSWNGQSFYAAGEVQPHQSEKKEIDGHPGFAILTENVPRDAPVTSLDASSDAIVAGPGPTTTVSDIKDSEDQRFTSADVAAISSANKSQTFKDEKYALFPDNAVSEKLPALSSPKHNLLGSEDVFSDALDNESIELSVNHGDQLSLSSSCIRSESHLLSEEHTPRSNVVSDHHISDENNYEQHYSPNSDFSIQLLEDTTTMSDPVSEKQSPEKVDYLSSLAQEELVTNGLSSSQNEENGKTPNQACDDIVDQENVSLSCGELSSLKSVSTDRDNIVEFHTSCEHGVDHGAFLKHDSFPDMHDEHADVSPAELCAQGTDVDPCHGNEEVEIGTHEKEPRQPGMISVREKIGLDIGELSQCSDKEEIEVAVIQKFTAKEEIISQPPSVSDSDTLDGVNLVHKPMPLTAVCLDEADSSAAVDESDAGPNLELVSHRTAEEHVPLTPEPSAAGTVQINSESIFSAIPIFISGEKENSSNHDSQLDAVSNLEQVHVSHDSQSLSDPQMVPSMPGRTSITVGGKDNIGTDLSHSEADPNIPLTYASMVPTLVSLKPSSETLGSTDDESNLLLLSSSTSEVGVHSEVRVSLQPNFKPSSLPLEDSTQVSATFVSSPCFPMVNSLHKNTSESIGNGLLYNFPILVPDIQCNLNDTPPLPPLPPLQWRMGKPRISPQGSIATTSKSLSGPGIFSTKSSDELLSIDPKTLGVSVQGAETSSQPASIKNRDSQSSSTEDAPLALDGQTAITENMRTHTLLLDASDKKIENSLRRRKALQDEMTPSTNASAPVVESSGTDSQRISSISYAEQMQPSSQHMLPLTQSIDAHQNYAVMPQNFQRDLLYPSNPFLGAPVTVDPRYQYGYRLFGGESLQPLATQDIIPRHGFYMPVGENMYGPPYSISLTEMETEKSNGRPLSILNRPRDPLIEAVASHDKSTLRKVSEIVQAQSKPKDDERNTMLDQIKQKSFSLKRTTITRPSIRKGHTTNLKVAAILEKANAIRQAFAGSDDEDNWSDG